MNGAVGAARLSQRRELRQRLAGVKTYRGHAGRHRYMMSSSSSFGSSASLLRHLPARNLLLIFIFISPYLRYLEALTGRPPSSPGLIPFETVELNLMTREAYLADRVTTLEAELRRLRRDRLERGNHLRFEA